MNKLILLLLMVVSSLGFSNEVWQPGKRVAIYSEKGVPQYPLLSINENNQVVIDDSNAVNVEGLNVSQASEKIKKVLGAGYQSSKIEFIDLKSMIKVTFLGDLEEPGGYWLPKNTDLSKVQHFLTLFENRLFSPAYSVIRAGSRQTVLQDEMSNFKVYDKDIVMVSLARKKVPDPVIIAEKKPKPEQGKK